MSKAEYRYYELSQEIPLLVLTGLSPSAWRKQALQNPQNITAYQISVLKG